MELIIKQYIDGVNDTEFNEESPITLSSYTYPAARMSVPTISGKFYHESALIFDGTQYVEFRNEKYFLLNTPTRKLSNTSIMYEYDVVFESERNKLNRVYFYDVVTSGYDKYFTESAVFTFNGTLTELANRLNASITRSDLDYTCIVDEDTSSDLFTFSFSNSMLFAAIGKCWSVAETQFYFVGHEIHFGEPPYEISEDVTTTINGIEETTNEPIIFKYGVDNQLLEIEKSNANFSVVNRATGVGGTENLPYYYPNNSDEGKITYTAHNFGDAYITYIDFNTFKKTFNLRSNLIVSYTKLEHVIGKTVSVVDALKDENGNTIFTPIVPVNDDTVTSITQIVPCTAIISAGEGISSIAVDIDYNIQVLTNPYSGKIKSSTLLATGSYSPYLLSSSGERVDVDTSRPSVIGNSHTFLFTPAFPIQFTLHYFIEVTCSNAGYGIDRGYYGDERNEIPNNYSISIIPSITAVQYNFDVQAWVSNEDKVVPKNSGIKVVGDIEEGAFITIDSISRIQTATNLMPPIYRKSGGKEVFYNALNDTYTKNGVPVVFTNEYNSLNPREYNETYDIKPTIVGVTNSAGERIDLIADIAYDKDDNSQRLLVEDESGYEYQHPFFYIRLPKMDGEFGFNIFDSNIAQDSMKLYLNTGTCAACSFEIKAIKAEENGEEVFYNPVQVDDNGDIISGNHGDILTDEITKVKDTQHDSSSASIWIAVLKDTEYITNQIFPNKDSGIVLNKADEYVLLNISLPEAYITYAENELENDIIDSLIENNEERFTFSIKFSRVYLANNPQVLDQLNEYSKINVSMDDVIYSLYVTSYQYRYESSSLLPEITVELSDAVGATTNAFQKYAAEIGDGIFSRVLAQKNSILDYAIRKDKEESTDYKLSLNGGLYVTNGINTDSATVYNDLTVGGEIKGNSGASFGGPILVGDGYSGIDSGVGTSITKDTIETDYIVARKGLKTQSIQINEIQAMSSEYYFSNSAEIDTVDQVVVNYNDRDNTLYKLGLIIKDGHENPFVAGDILIGKKNNLFANQERLSSDDVKQSYDVWLKVYSVDGDYINCEQYDSSLFKSEIDAANDIMGNYTVTGYVDGEKVKEYPSVDVIYPPEENMILVHRGNVDPINHSDRTNCWYRSSEDGLDVWLENVTSPILTVANYACWSGIPKVTPTYQVVKSMYSDKAKTAYISALPDGTEPTYDSLGNIIDENGDIIDFSEGFNWDGDKPSIFTKTLVYQDGIQVDYEGVIHYQELYRGIWSLETASSATEYYKATISKHDVVYYNNAKYEYISATSGDTNTPDATDSWRLLEAAIQGENGEDGVGIWQISVYYCYSDDGENYPSSGWESSIPTEKNGKYLWVKHLTKLTNGQTSYSYSVSADGEQGEQGEQGLKGDKGDTGVDGVAGEDGVGILSTVITYNIDASDTIVPTSGWISQVPNLIKGEYLWTKTHWTYTNGDEETGYTVSYIAKDGNTGEDGIAGKDGVGIETTTITYAQSTSGTIKPTSGWVDGADGIPSVANGEFLWTRTVWTYTDGDEETGYSVAKMGETGAKGDNGTNGTDGTNGTNGTSAKPREYLYYLSSATTFAELDSAYTSSLPSQNDTYNEDNYNPTTDWVSSAPSLDDGKNRWATYRDYNTTYGVWDGFKTEYLETNWAERGVQGPAIKFSGEFVTGTDYPYSDTLQVYVRIGSSYFIRKNQNATYPTDLTGIDDSRWTTYWETDSVTNHILAIKIDAQEIDVDSLWTAFLDAEKIWTKSVEIHDDNGNAIAGVNSNDYDFWSGDSTNPNFHVKDGNLYAKDGEFSGLVYSSQGRIGAFNFNTAGIDNGNPTSPMSLTPSVYSMSQYNKAIEINTDSAEDADYPVIKIENERASSSTGSNVGLEIECKYSSESNKAIKINSGQISNYNMPIRTVNSNTTLSYTDTYVVGNNSTSTITITLPNFGVEQDGHVFYIKAHTNGDVLIKPEAGVDMMTEGGNVYTSTSGYDNLSSVGDAVMYVYCYKLKRYMGGGMR